MARGGARPGAGRPKGRKPDWMPKKADEKRPVPETKAEIKATAIEDGISPLDLMLSLMRDEEQPLDLRIKMAQLAAPFVHQKPGELSGGKKGEQAVKAAKAANRFAPATAPNVIPIKKQG